MSDTAKWNGAPALRHLILDGSYARLEPLVADLHAADLAEAALASGAADRFRYLGQTVPVAADEVREWVDDVCGQSDPLFFAVIDKNTGRAEGRQALMRIDQQNGVVEVGNIMWGPAMTRSRIATEALFLFADHVFGLGYRRFEWKCDDLNAPSKRAALRFGFQYEGLFRQHMVIKGKNRDTAWYSIIDSEWPRLRAGYLRWLQPENFDALGQQLSRLEFQG